MIPHMFSITQKRSKTKTCESREDVETRPPAFFSNLDLDLDSRELPQLGVSPNSGMPGINLPWKNWYMPPMKTNENTQELMSRESGVDIFIEVWLVSTWCLNTNLPDIAFPRTNVFPACTIVTVFHPPYQKKGWYPQIEQPQVMVYDVAVKPSSSWLN